MNSFILNAPQEKQKEVRKAKKEARKGEGNNWVGVFNFLLFEGNWKKSKIPTWRDDRVVGGRYRTKSLLPGYAPP